jgi:hypothetical protein
MPGNPRDLLMNAERWFPVHIRVVVPTGGFGQRCKNRSKPAPDFGRRRQVISAESGT